MIRARRDSVSISGESVERAPDGAPIAFRIWKQGLNKTDKGDTVFTAKSAEVLLEEQARRGNLYSVDADHLSLSKDAPPEARKAVGWHRLEVRDGDLWAVDVSWVDSVRSGLLKDPPEWRYFSPAYDVIEKTGEVVSYLNTALTNNPATWGVTALATRASASTGETPMADEEKKPEGEKSEADAVLAQFKKMGKAAAIAAMNAAFPDEEKKPEGDKDEKKDAEEEPKKDAEEPDGDEKKAAKAATRREAELIATVGEQDRRLKELEDEREQAKCAKILAARTDLTAKQLASLSKKTSAELPELLELIPVTHAKKHPNAVVQVNATRGAGQAGDAVEGMHATRMSDRAEELDRKMFGTSSAPPVRFVEGNKFEIRTMTPSEAREHVKTIEARRTAASKNEVK